MKRLQLKHKGKLLRHLLTWVCLPVLCIACLGCSEPKQATRNPDIKAINAILGCDNDERRGDVIFIHGLDGQAFSTWQHNNDPDFYWPKWLGQQYTDVGIWSVNYSASSSDWFGSSMPIEDRAKNLLEEMRLRKIGKRPLIFVAHSLGGLVVKQMLNDCITMGDLGWEEIGENTAGVVFLATPNAGSSLADFLKRRAKIARISVQVEQLEENRSMLRNLNIWYRNNVSKLGIETRVYFENEPMPVVGLIVDQSSADPGISGVTPIGIDGNHLTICKPRDKGDQVCLAVAEFVNTRLKPPASPAGVTLSAYIKLFLSKRKDPSEIIKLKNDYDEKLVRGKVYVCGAFPHTTDPYLLVGNQKDAPVSDQVLAYFRPSNFKESLDKGTQIEMQGTISEKTNILGAILYDCEVVKADIP